MKNHIINMTYQLIVGTVLHYVMYYATALFVFAIFGKPGEYAVYLVIPGGCVLSGAIIAAIKNFRHPIISSGISSLMMILILSVIAGTDPFERYRGFDYSRFMETLGFLLPITVPFSVIGASLFIHDKSDF